MSLVMVIATVVLVAGATKSVFSDQEEIADNTISTGTLALTLNHSAGKPFSIDNAYPGFVSDWEYLDIFNAPFPAVAGQLPFEANMSINKTGGSDALWNYIRIEMKTSGNDSDCTNNDAGEKTIHNGLANTFVNGTVVSDIAYWSLANEDDLSGPPDNIRAGFTERICQRVGVDNSADNTVQGQSVTFTEVVDAVQDND